MFPKNYEEKFIIINLKNLNFTVYFIGLFSYLINYSGENFIQKENFNVLVNNSFLCMIFFYQQYIVLFSKKILDTFVFIA